MSNDRMQNRMSIDPLVTHLLAYGTSAAPLPDAMRIRIGIHTVHDGKIAGADDGTELSQPSLSLPVLCGLPGVLVARQGQ